MTESVQEKGITKKTATSYNTTATDESKTLGCVIRNSIRVIVNMLQRLRVSYALNACEQTIQAT